MKWCRGGVWGGLPPQETPLTVPCPPGGSGGLGPPGISVNYPCLASAAAVPCPRALPPIFFRPNFFVQIFFVRIFFVRIFFVRFFSSDFFRRNFFVGIFSSEIFRQNFFVRILPPGSRKKQNKKKFFSFFRDPRSNFQGYISESPISVRPPPLFALA